MTMKAEELVFTPAHQHTPGKKGQILNLTVFLLFLKKRISFKLSHGSGR